MKQKFWYEPKATTSAPKNEATNVGNSSKSSSMLNATAISMKECRITMSNFAEALNDESDEDVENVYDKLTNLFPSSKTIGSSSTYMVAAG
nr:hypothetical protein [Tanacetum cinerariifolium]